MKTVFFDVDTQLDFLCAAGALYTPGSETILDGLFELTRYAAAQGIKIVSTADAHGEDDPEFKTWRPHCVMGTTGQQKLAGTSLPAALFVTSAPGALESVREKVEAARQIVIEKQSIECFTNPNLEPLLELLNADRYIVYGVATEVCVECAVFGLLETGAQVMLVTDAIKSLNIEEERKTLARFKGAGGSLTNVRMVTGK